MGRYDGWRSDIEDRAGLLAMSVPFRLDKAVRGPRSWSHREWLKIEDQGQQGSCSGHAGTSSLEVLNWIDTGGTVEQLCRQFCYIEGQKPDNIRGDQGATISGVIKALRSVGICREALWPYTGQYRNNPPQKCYDEAKAHLLIGQVTKITSVQMAADYLRSGTGVIYFGCDCVKSIMESKGRIESMSGASAGGHAMCWVSMDGDDFDMPQSWGTSYGENGWAKWATKAAQQMIAHPNSEVFGITDLQEYGPQRDVSFVGAYG